MTPEELASKHLGKVEECAVTPAQHPLGMAGRPRGVGKSWTRETGEPMLNEYDLPEGDLTARGLYFQERWEDALAVDPPFIYLNDWNEWTAGKYNFGDTWFLGRENSPFAFVDQYNAEFNRTIQPMKGGYTDNYYGPEHPALQGRPSHPGEQGLQEDTGGRRFQGLGQGQSDLPGYARRHCLAGC